MAETAFLGSFEGEDEMARPTWETVDADVIGRGLPLFRGSFICLEERMVHRIACSVQPANDRRSCLMSTFVFVRLVTNNAVSDKQTKKLQVKKAR